MHLHGKLHAFTCMALHPSRPKVVPGALPRRNFNLRHKNFSLTARTPGSGSRPGKSLSLLCTQQTGQAAAQSNITADEFSSHRVLVERLGHTTNYPQLASWLLSNQQEVYTDPNLAVLAMVKAVDLLPTLEDLDEIEDDEIIKRLSAQDQVCMELLPLLRQSLPKLPLDTVAYMAKAACLLGDNGYDEGFFYGVVEALQLAAQNPTGNQIGLLPCRPDVLGLNLVLLVGALAQAGYYDPEAMDLLAKETSGVVSQVEPAMLASLVEGYMELQHLDRQMLTAIGQQLLQQRPPARAVDTGGLVLGSLSGTEAVQVALAYAFFNVQNSAFYQVLLARATSVMQQQAGEGIDEEKAEEWQDMVMKLHMACTLAPNKAVIPPGASTLLADEARKLLPDFRESAAQQAALVWDEEGGQSSEELIEFGGLDLLTIRQVTAILAVGKPGDQLSGDQQQQQQELPMPCTLADSQAPWFTVDVALPGRVGIVVLPSSSFCRNMIRLRGSIQARLRCMQELGWAVWPISVDDWINLMDEATDESGNLEGEAMSSYSLIARWVAAVAHAEKAQILQRVEDAYEGEAESQEPELYRQATDQIGRSRHDLFSSYLKNFEQDESERVAGFFERLQGKVWEGVEQAIHRRQQLVKT